MKKHFTRTLAMLLVLAMVLSVFPTFALAADVEVDGSATLLTAAPADGKQEGDYVEQFLFATGEGYCVHYAAAMLQAEPPEEPPGTR